jgi:hypothetical protein
MALLSSKNAGFSHGLDMRRRMFMIMWRMMMMSAVRACFCVILVMSLCFLLSEILGLRIYF